MPRSLIRYASQSGSLCLAALDDFGTVLWTVSNTVLRTVFAQFGADTVQWTVFARGAEFIMKRNLV